MRRRRSSALLLALLVLRRPARGAWTLADERRMAADAASFAPPDFKTQLARHSRRLMQGVSDAAAGEAWPRRSPRTALPPPAAPARSRKPFAVTRRSTRSRTGRAGSSTSFRSRTPRAGRRPSTCPGAPASSAFRGALRAPRNARGGESAQATARDRYDAAVTLATRLLAWIWKTAGGNASSVTQYPAAKGPYVVRE